MLAAGLGIGSLERLEWLRIAGLMLGYVLLASLVRVAACAPPTARALRVEPQEALRVEGGANEVRAGGRDTGVGRSVSIEMPGVSESRGEPFS